MKGRKIIVVKIALYYGAVGMLPCQPGQFGGLLEAGWLKTPFGKPQKITARSTANIKYGCLRFEELC